MRIRYSAMLIILPCRQGLVTYPDDRPAQESTSLSVLAGCCFPGGPTPGSALPGGTGGGLFRAPAQRLHGGRGVVGPVDRGARAEHVGTGLRAPLDGLLAHPAVHLEPHRR